MPSTQKKIRRMRKRRNQLEGLVAREQGTKVEHVHDTPSHTSIQVPKGPPKEGEPLDNRTLRFVYNFLRTQYPNAASYMVELITDPPSNPEAWVEENLSSFKNKTELIRAVRDRFNMPLKPTKSLVDAYF